VNIRNLTKLLSVAVACLGSTSLMSTAHAYQVKIDCHGTGGIPTWADTPNRIIINVYYDNNPENGLKFFNGGIPASLCDGEDEVVFSVPGISTSHVTGVGVETSGTQAFWIDQVLLKSDLGGTDDTWGIDNTVGWCISNDPLDGSSANCPDPAEHIHIFNR
jgi:hypothetical protein